MIARHLACRLAAALAVAGSLVGPLSGQSPTPRPQPFAPQLPGAATPVTPATQPSAQQPSPARPFVPQPDSVDEMSQVLVIPRQPDFSGFPVFPSRLSGYGNYPLPFDPAADPAANPILGPSGGFGQGGIASLFGMLPPAAPEPPGWPAWVRTATREPLPFAPDLALLVQQENRVWWRPAADDVFVPMFFHDKFETLTVGGEVEVRQTGEFDLLLHDSTRMHGWGPTWLSLVALDEAKVEIGVAELTKLRVVATRREHTLLMPDGSRLILPAPAVDDEPLGPAKVEVVRDSEPGQYGGRATLNNTGRRVVVWQHAFGRVDVPPQHRIMFFLSPPVAPAPMPLAVDGASVERGDREVVCRSGGDAEVAWCGARFSLPAGTELTLESLQGQAFAEPPPAGSAPAESAPGVSVSGETPPAATPATARER